MKLFQLIRNNQEIVVMLAHSNLPYIHVSLLNIFQIVNRTVLVVVLKCSIPISISTDVGIELHSITVHQNWVNFVSM